MTLEVKNYSKPLFLGILQTGMGLDREKNFLQKY